MFQCSYLCVIRSRQQHTSELHNTAFGNSLEITTRFLRKTASMIYPSGVFNLPSVRCPKSRFTEPILTLQSNTILFTAIQRQKVAGKTQRLVTTKICVNTAFQVIQTKKTEF
jgi:hypothetical protein